MENLGDASFLPLFSIEVTMSRREFTSNYWGALLNFCPPYDPGFFSLFSFSFLFHDSATSNRKQNDCISNFIVFTIKFLGGSVRWIF